MGNSLQLEPSRLHLCLERWARRYGSLYRAQLGPTPAIVTTDDELIRELLKRRPDGFRRQSSMQRLAAELGLDGLFTAEGERWRKQRKLFSLAFVPRQIRILSPILLELTERLRQLWLTKARAGEIIDVHRDLRAYAVDVTSWIAFGEDIDSLRRGSHGFRADFDKLFELFNQRLLAVVPYWRVIQLPRDRASARQRRALRTELGVRIAAARENLAAHPERPANLLEALLAARDEDEPGERLDDEEVYANVATILLAGEDTTSNTATWMLDALARDRVMLGRLREEVGASFGARPVAASLDEVDAMPYCRGVTHEALRLRSAAPMLFVESLVDQQVGDLALPAGTLVIMLTRMPGLEARRFAQPARYEPTRWIDAEREAGPHTPKAMLSFGYGPRMCPGRALACFELALVASMVAHNFELELVEREPPREVFGFTMRPSAVRLRLRERAVGS